MKSLFSAIALGVVFSVVGCSGSELPPVKSAFGVKHDGPHNRLKPADCPSPNDTGGIMTGDGGC